MFSTPFIPPNASKLMPSFLDEYHSTGVVVAGSTYTFTDSAFNIGAETGHRHIIWLTSHSTEMRDQHNGVQYRGSLSVDNAEVELLAQANVNSSLGSYDIGGSFSVYYTKVIAGSTATIRLTSSGYDIHSAAHCVAYEVDKKPTVVDTVTGSFASTSGATTIVPEYKQDCWLAGFGIGMTNNGLFGTEAMSSTISTWFPTSSLDCAVRIENASQGGNVMVKRNTNTSDPVWISHTQNSRNTNYPSGRKAFAVTLA